MPIQNPVASHLAIVWQCFKTVFGELGIFLELSSEQCKRSVEVLSWRGASVKSARCDKNGGFQGKLSQGLLDILLSSF
jgi:hypothetical protein